MTIGGVRRRTLVRAAEALGGMSALGKFLKVSTETATDWAAGVQPIPEAAFLRAVDLVLDLADDEMEEFAVIRGHDLSTAARYGLKPKKNESP